MAGTIGVNALNSIGMSRRRLMLGAAAIALQPSAAAPSVDQNATSAFLALSEVLTGQTGLPRTLGDVYLRALLDNKDTAAAMQRAVTAGEAEADDLAVLRPRVLRQWYTGVISSEEGATVESYENALVWKAMGFEQPLGFCRSTVGAWAEPGER